jgi:hypothetical protein
MENSKLVALLETLETSEWQQFVDFVGSPFFNKNEALGRLLAYLCQTVPVSGAVQLSKERAYQAVAPGQAYDPKQLSYWMNYLLKLAEQFLAIKRYQEVPHRQAFDTLNEFSERKLEKHYGFLYKKVADELSAAPIDTVALRQQYELEEIASRHFIRQQVRSADESLQHVADTLDEWYFLQKLKFSCEMLNRQAIISASYELAFVEEVSSFLARQPERTPLVDIYFHIYLSLAQEGDQHFSHLIERIRQHAEKIHPLERREIYLYAINFCARKIRQGQEEYVPIVLDLYIQGISDQSLFEGSYLSHWTYTNVVKLALREKRFDWAERFIRDYGDKLPPNAREDALHFNLAELLYQRGKYGEVLSHLNQLNFSDLFYHIGSRTVLAKTYYESQEEESLLSLLASFSNFLRRNKKISPNLQKTYLNFCNLLLQLLYDKPNKREKLKQQLETTQPLAERAWLLKVWAQRR